MGDFSLFRKKRNQVVEDGGTHSSLTFDHYQLPDNLKKVLQRPEYFDMPGESFARLAVWFLDGWDKWQTRNRINRQSKLLDKVRECSPSLRADLEIKLEFVSAAVDYTERFLSEVRPSADALFAALEGNDPAHKVRCGMEFMRFLAPFCEKIRRHIETNQLSIHPKNYESCRDQLNQIDYKYSIVVHKFYSRFDAKVRSVNFLVSVDFPNHYGRQNPAFDEALQLTVDLLEELLALNGLASSLDV